MSEENKATTTTNPPLAPHEYESGLEVAEVQRWRNSASYPEVAASAEWDDKKTATMPQVMQPPMLAARSPVSDFSPQTTDYQSTIAAFEHKPLPPKPPTVCGVRRKVFYIVLGVGLFIAVAAIAIGVGAGIALGKKAAAPSSPFANATLTQGNNVVCPASNNFIYQASGTNRYFKVICGVDYHRDNGAVDSGSVSTATLGDCIDACAKDARCLAAGWGNYYGANTCFMKSAIGTPHDSALWAFTIEQKTT